MALSDPDQEALYNALEYRDEMMVRRTDDPDADARAFEQATDLLFWVVESIATKAVDLARGHSVLPMLPDGTPAKPKTRSKMSADELRTFERERKRAQRAAKSVPLISATNGGTSVGHLVGQISGTSVGQHPPTINNYLVNSCNSLSLNSGEILKEERENCRILPIDSSGTIGGTTSGTDGGTEVVGQVDGTELWRALWDEWVRVVHGGVRAGDPRTFRAGFMSVARDCIARHPSDPLGYGKRVLGLYVAERRSAGRTPEPRFFASDFASTADKGGNGHSKRVAPDLDEYRKVSADRKAALKAGDLVVVAACENRLASIQRGWDNAKQL